jgi:hypothetical protein
MHSSKSVRPNIWDDRALKTLERVKRSYRRLARRQEAGGDARVAQVRKLFGRASTFATKRYATTAVRPSGYAECNCLRDDLNLRN